MSVPLTQEQIDELCDAFVQLDRNRDGFVDSNEIDLMLLETFPTAGKGTRDRVRDMMIAEGDTNKDGKIDIGEFLALIAQKQYDLLMGGGVSPPGVAEALSGGTDDPLVTSIMNQLTPEQIDMYRDTFIRLDRDGDGYVGRQEMMDSVRDHVGTARFTPLAVYLDKIFDVADKDMDNKLSLTEFLSSFADGPGVVPADVVLELVDSIRVRLTDDEICALQESFRSIDTNHDNFIDADELFVALKELLLPKVPDLTDEVFSDIVMTVMATADRDRDGKLNLSEFIRSFQEDQGVLPTAFIDGRAKKQENKRRLTAEEVKVLKEAFATLDENNDGFVDYAEMNKALTQTLQGSTLDKEQVRDLVDLVMVTADRNHQGKVSLTDFIRSFVQNEEVMGITVAVAQEKAKLAAEKLQGLLDSGEVTRMIKVFDWLDVNHDGYLSRNELNGVLQECLREHFPQWDEETLQTVIQHIFDGADTDHDGKISLREFINSFVTGSGVLPPEAVHDWGEQIRRELSPEELDAVRRTFILMDTNHDGFVTRDELQSALGDALQEVIQTQEDLERVTNFVLSKVDENHDGRISLREFVHSFEKDQGVLPVAAGEGEEETPMEQQPVSSPVRPDSINRPRSPVGVQLGGKVTPQMAEQQPHQTAKVEQRQEPLPQLAASPGPVVQHTPMSTQNLSVVSVQEQARSPIVNDVSGVCVSEGQLYHEFLKYDTQRNGFLDRQEFKKAYMSMENFGLEPSQQEIDNLFMKYGGADEKLSFDEFCVLMLQRSRM